MDFYLAFTTWGVKSQALKYVVTFFQVSSLHIISEIEKLHFATFLHDKAAQGGKSKPDSYSAIIKAQVTRSVDAGNDCSNAKNFAKCIAMNTGVSNVVVMLGGLKDIKDRRKLKQEITGIRDFNTFIFNNQG